MITKIHLENFKGFKERQTIELKPITLLFGPNSGGKSTVIQAIHYMHEILERRNFDPDRTVSGGDAIDLGGFENMVYGHDLTLPIILKFDLDLSKDDLPSYLDDNEKDILNLEGEDDWDGPAEFFAGIKSAYITVETRWNEELNKPIVVRYETGVNDEYVAQIHLERVLANGSLHYVLSKPNFKHSLLPKQKVQLFENEIEASPLFWDYFCLLEEPKFDNLDNGIFLVNATAIPNWSEKLSLLYMYDTNEIDDIKPWRIERKITNFLSRNLVGIGKLLNDELAKLVYIGPLRKIPPRNYVSPRFVADQNWADGSAAWDLIYQSEGSFIKAVNTWLLDRLHCGFSIKVTESTKLIKDEPLITSLMSASILDEETNIKSLLRNKKYQKEFSFIDANTGIECQAMDIGVGISQVFPVVVAALENKFPLVLIEQPELHIHPAIQVNLGDLFISAIKNNDRMIITETHSEHMILRILKRIEQTTQNELPPDIDPVNPEQVSVMWFEPTIDGIKVTNLPIDETGEFKKKWPRGFFEERAEELFG